MGDFVHLHVHSHYSILDGTASPTQLVRAAHQMGFRALGLTDRGVLHGAVEFVQACADVGIKPIIGCELQVDGHRLTLIAETDQGYTHLSQLSTKSFAATGEPHVSFETLTSHHDGLIALSGTLDDGEIPSLLKDGNLDAARMVAQRYVDVFGSDRFFLELIDHGEKDQQRVNRSLVGLSKSLGIPLVATNDVHYVQKDLSYVRTLLHAIRSGSRLDPAEVPLLTATPGEAYLKSANEMAGLFCGVGEAVLQTAAIAERCEVKVFSHGRLPAFPGRKDEHAATFLRRLVLDHASKRYGSPLPTAVSERIEHELKVIETMGYEDYFLIVWDIVRFAKEQSIAVGPGRGSSASSLVAYVLNITDVDPLAYGLVFERFLNPERVSLPDIDIDFCYERRGEVIEYIKRRYGTDRVAQICAFGRLTARAAVRDIGRVLGVPSAEVDRMARVIPAGPGVTLAGALHDRPQLRRMIAQNDTLRQLFELSKAVEGVPRHLSVHAAGIVMSDQSLIQRAPMCRTPDGSWITQFSGEDLESLGFLKMDLLGLRTLTVIDQCVRSLEKKGILIRLDSISLEDTKVYEYLCRGETDALFQIETGLFKSLLTEVKPHCFEDLIAILALGRPGPMARVADYLKLRRGEQDAPLVHPKLKELLSETHGLMIYQEQVMLVAKELAGYRPGEADLLRRAMAKKDLQLMQKEQSKFVSTAIDRGIDRHDAQRIFDAMSQFAEYGFPKSHSAAYAKLTYATAYLKVYYPAPFMVAQLNSLINHTERVGRYIRECRRMGVTVQPPDINESDSSFTYDDGGIRYGLAAIKNVGATLSHRIVAARGDEPYRSMEDFLRRLTASPLPKTAFESLVRAGAFDRLCRGRENAFRQLVRLGWSELGGGRFDHRQEPLFEWSHSASDPADSALSHEQTIRDEVELLGTYVAVDPLAPFYKALSAWTVPDQPHKIGGRLITVAGVVTRTRVSQRRGQTDMITLDLHDVDGASVQTTFFDQNLLGEQIPAIGQVVVVQGRLLQSDDAGQTDLVRLKGQRLVIPEDIPITVSVRDVDTIHQLSQVINAHPGTRPVVLHLESATTRTHVVLPPQAWVSGSDVSPHALQAMAQGNSRLMVKDEPSKGEHP